MGKLNRREFLSLTAASAAGGLPALLAACGKRLKSVRFLNWAGYIGKDTLSNFEHETGIIVDYDFYASEEALAAKLAARTGAYDLIVAPDHMVGKLKEQRLLSPIPHDRLEALDGIARRFRDPAYDPGLAYSVPYLWGTTGLGIDTKSVRARPDSWRVLWEEKYKGRLSMLDDAREALQCALIVLGLPLDAKGAAPIDKARDLLLKQRPLLKDYDSSTYANGLADHELWLAQGWSGDVTSLALQGRSVDFVIPREGSFLWVDSLCLPRASRHTDEAVILMNYLTRPKVSAEISQATCYATPNERALPLLPPSVRDDPRIFPDPAALARLQLAPTLPAEAESLWLRAWEQIRA